MYKNKRVLACIPARSGSKGIRNKNVILLGNKPLLAHTILVAQEAGCFTDIVVSTDSLNIAQVAEDFGAMVPFLRPAELAGDEAKGEPVAAHALRELARLGNIYDIVVYLQPTSPLRKTSDILGALDMFIDQGLPSLASVSAVTEHPLFMRTITAEGHLRSLLGRPSDVRRQDLPPYYIINGAIYINHARDVLNSWRGNDNLYGYIMDAVNSLDINTHDDLARAELLLTREITS